MNERLSAFLDGEASSDDIEAVLAQLLRDAGSDQLAGIAATARPVKVAAWVVTFLGVIAAWLIRRFAAPTA